MSVNIASRLASIALARSKLLKGYKSYEKAPTGGYYIYSGSKVPAVQVWTGGGGTSYGAGAGDRLSNVPPQRKYREKQRFSLEDIIDIAGKYRTNQYQQNMTSLALRAYQAYRKQMGIYDRLRPQTGELTYNPIFQTYNERRTWLTPRPYWWNTMNKRYHQERIFRDRREYYARSDFYNKQIERLIKLIPTLIPRKPNNGGGDRRSLYGFSDAWTISTKKNKFRKGKKNRKSSFWYYSRKKSRSRRSDYSRRNFGVF